MAGTARGKAHEVGGGLDEVGAGAGSVAIPLRPCRPCEGAEEGNDKDCFVFHRLPSLDFLYSAIAVTHGGIRIGKDGLFDCYIEALRRRRLIDTLAFHD